MAYSVSCAAAAATFMAAFYERLFAGTVSAAGTAGRQQLFRTTSGLTYEVVCRSLMLAGAGRTTCDATCGLPNWPPPWLYWSPGSPCPAAPP